MQAPHPDGETSPGMKRPFVQPKIHPRKKPSPLKSLLWLALLAAATPLINAQYTEMINWITGSNVVDAPRGANNSYPQARYYHSGFYDPTLKLFHVFGGQTQASALLNDFWNYNLTSDTWTLLSSVASLTAGNAGSFGTAGQESSTYLPSARFWGSDIYDPQTRCFYSFGGYNFIGGLWRYNLTASTWSLLSGNNAASQFGTYPASAGAYGTDGATYLPGGRHLASLAFDPPTQYLFMYGGHGNGKLSGSVFLDELWRFNVVTKQWAFLRGTIDTVTLPIYGTRGIPSSSNYPGGRWAGCSFYDPSRRSMYLVTGHQSLSGVWRNTNDFWQFNITDSQWTWISGSNGSQVSELSAAFPVLGAEASQPAPYARRHAACFYNATTSNFFLLGGFSRTSGGGETPTGDIWRFNIGSGNWSFIGGKTGIGLAVTFGTRGVEATTNSMGNAMGAVMFQDGNRIYHHYGILTTSTTTYSAILSSRIICPATQYWSNFLCYPCTGSMLTQVIDGRSSCVACPANSSCSGGVFSCFPGFTASESACVGCSPGSSKNVSGNQACTSCPGGSFASGSASQACTSCPGGSFASGSGNQACTSCPSGSFASGSGNQACTNCSAGSFASGSGNQACTNCSAGSFASGSGNQACTNCPVGSYASGSGNQACTNCPNGSYSDTAGSSSCTACPAGATCDTSSSTCNPGYFKTNSTHCAGCPANTFKEASGNDAFACLTCPPNFETCNSTTFVCSRGFERLGSFCSACTTTPSMYKPLIGNHACTLCPAGATCNNTDFTCLEGYYQTGSNCFICPVNMYKSVKSNDACLNCPVGASCVDPTSFVCQAGYKKTGNNCTVVTGPFYKPMYGNMDPTACPAGANCNATDFICVAGYYQSGSYCFPCDSNTFKSFDGNTASCVPCPQAATCTRTDFTCSAGYYQTGNNCTMCPANMYKPASGNEACVSCPTNATCDSTTFTCGAGFFRNGTMCSPCKTGWYKSGPGNSDCTSCPNNAVCDTRSFTCNSGFFAAGSVCSPCAPGYFKSEPSNDLCLMCPADSTCNRTMYQCNAGYFPLTGGCSSCPSGFYKPTIGNKDCLACPAHATCDISSFSCSAGYFQNGSSCSPCQAGTYNDKAGAKSCAPCPNNATCNSTSFSCQTGFYTRESSCTVCPRGTFKDSGGSCADCPSNSLCESDTYYCNPGFTPFRKECIPCASSMYKGFIGNDACLNCPSGAVCNGTHFTCASGHQLLLGACTACPANSFKGSTGNTSCLTCPAGATCNTTAITGCPSGYQPGEFECQPASKDNTGTDASVLGPLSFAIIGCVGGLLLIAGLIMAVVVMRSREHKKSAMEEKERAERAETALARMSTNQLGNGYTNTAPPGATFNGFTQGGTFNPFAQAGKYSEFTQGGTFSPFAPQSGTFSGFNQGQTAMSMSRAFPGSTQSGTFNGFNQGQNAMSMNGAFPGSTAQNGMFTGFNQGQTATSMNGAFPGSATSPSLARNAMTGSATPFFGQQNFDTAGRYSPSQ